MKQEIATFHSPNAIHVITTTIGVLFGLFSSSHFITARGRIQEKYTED